MDVLIDSAHTTYGGCLCEFHHHRLCQILHLILEHIDGDHTAGNCDVIIPASEQRCLLYLRAANGRVAGIATEKRLWQVHVITTKGDTISRFWNIGEVQFNYFKIKCCPGDSERCPRDKVTECVSDLVKCRQNTIIERK